jgi:hypothetical protein
MEESDYCFYPVVIPPDLLAPVYPDCFDPLDPGCSAGINIIGWLQGVVWIISDVALIFIRLLKIDKWYISQLTYMFFQPIFDSIVYSYTSHVPFGVYVCLVINFIDGELLIIGFIISLFIIVVLSLQVSIVQGLYDERRRDDKIKSMSSGLKDLVSKVKIK